MSTFKKLEIVDNIDGHDFRKNPVFIEKDGKFIGMIMRTAFNNIYPFDTDGELAKNFPQTLKLSDVIIWLESNGYKAVIQETYSHESQYFTPAIHEITYGYECEILSTAIFTATNIRGIGSIPNTVWVPHKIENIPPDTSMIIRVPYLTKDEIQKKGWDFADYSKSNVGYKEAFYKQPVPPLNRLLELRYDYKTKRLWIKDKFAIKVIYDGECKDINTFTLICKKLDIT